MKSRGYLLATTSGVAAVAAAGGVQAADMAMKTPVVAPPPPALWAGWYVGVNAGTNWQHATNLGYGTTSVTTDATGFIGGGQIGYNWQNGNYVYGLEADFDGLTGKGSSNPTGAKGSGNINNRITWLSTIRTRAGLALGNTMAYITGGLAIGEVKDNFGPFSCCTKSASKTRVGWTVGGGVETFLTQNWTLGAEALFVDLGQYSGPNFNCVECAGKATKFSHQAIISRLKLNYKF